MIIGYVRTLSLLDNPNLQIKKLEAAGCRRVVREKLSSKKERSNLKLILEKLSKGDILMVTSIEKLATSLRDLTHILNRIRKAEANICFLDNGIDSEKNPDLFKVASHFAQFDNKVTQVNLTSRPGPKRRFSDQQIREMIRMYEGKVKVATICETFQVSESSFWRFKQNHYKNTAISVQ